MTRSLEQRLAKLETENRRMKLGGAVALVVLGVVALTAMVQEPEPPNITAKQITIVDDDGNTRISLGVNDEGASAILLSHPSNMLAQSLLLSSGTKTNVPAIVSYASGVTLEEQPWIARFLISSDELRFGHQFGANNQKVSLSLSHDGLSFDRDGRTWAQLGELELETPTGVQTKYSRATFTLFDEDAKVVFQAPGR